MRPISAAIPALSMLLVLVAPGAAAGPAAVARSEASGAPVVVYGAPVQPLLVVHPFVAPSTPYGPGHRGVDLAVPRAAVVRTAAAGVVLFAGVVAGRGIAVVRHADGVSTEYEPLRPQVHTGDRVAARQVLGRVAGTHGDCPPDRCLHWGARRDGSYLDPLLLLRPLGPVRLLPWTDP